MPEEYPLVSIITVNYNQLEVTCEMLDSIRSLAFNNLEVILVDNASERSPKKVIETKYPEVKLIQSQRNLGFSGGNNLGIKASSGKYLFFVNNDTELKDGLIEGLLALFEQEPQLGIVSPMIYYHPHSHEADGELIQYAGSTPVNSFTARNKQIGEKEIDRGQYKKAIPTAYVHGAAMMIPAKVVEEVGGMPEDFFLYYEELDWSEQIRNAGYKVFVAPQCKIYHKESVTVGALSTLKTYYLTRNRIYFMRRNRKWWQLMFFSLFLIFITIPKNVAKYLLKRQWDHLKAFLSGVFWNLKRISPVKKDNLAARAMQPSK